MFKMQLFLFFAAINVGCQNGWKPLMMCGIRVHGISSPVVMASLTFYLPDSILENAIHSFTPLFGWFACALKAETGS